MKRAQWLCLFLLVAAASCSTSKKTVHFGPGAAGFFTTAVPEMHRFPFPVHVSDRVRTSSRDTRTRSGIIASWKEQTVSVSGYHKILVLAVVSRAGQTLQKSLESRFSDCLQQAGYHAIPSLAIQAGAELAKIDPIALTKRMEELGIDAVLTIVLTDKQRVVHCSPANIYTPGHGYYYNSLWTYLNVSCQRAMNQPAAGGSRYFLESNLYDFRSQKLVYSAQTQSYDPFSPGLNGAEYPDIIFRNMKRQNILQGNATAQSKPVKLR